MFEYDKLRLDAIPDNTKVTYQYLCSKPLLVDVYNVKDKRQYDSFYIKIRELNKTTDISSMRIEFYDEENMQRFLEVLRYEKYYNTNGLRKDLCEDIIIKSDSGDISLYNTLVSSINAPLGNREGIYNCSIDITFEYVTINLKDSDYTTKLQNEYTQEINKRIMDEIVKTSEKQFYNIPVSNEQIHDDMLI